jgi:hypothetical protein
VCESANVILVQFERSICFGVFAGHFVHGMVDVEKVAIGMEGREVLPAVANWMCTLHTTQTSRAHLRWHVHVTSGCHMACFACRCFSCNVVLQWCATAAPPMSTDISQKSNKHVLSALVNQVANLSVCGVPHLELTRTSLMRAICRCAVVPLVATCSHA